MATLDISKRDSFGRFKAGNKPPDRTGIKHTKETRDKMKRARVGRKPNLGKHHSEEFKKLQSERVSQQWRDGLRKPTRKGKTTSIETKEKLSILRRGEKNPAWRGGVTTLNYQIRRCFKSRVWRSDVFTRDDFTCQHCGVRGGYIEAHHIKEFAKIVSEYRLYSIEDALVCEELWSINNGITLCKNCHEKTKTYANNRFK